ncbi:MAG: aromatic ring-hydroxylating oxygenase subunit alpha [Blastomonas fulva]|uniref:aromatic ring-hydroxylating oxygenase subunit alpha n=1 Tax=Blastomonas fulva TaxID=1550728 RepID=UPI0040348AC6
MDAEHTPITQVPSRRMHTLESLNESQIEAIRKIPPYGTQPPPVMTVRYPAAHFTERARFEQERDTVFRKMAVPIMPSARISQPGTAITHHGYGMALLLVRDKAGTLRVFLNACQHKGAKLVEGCALQKLSRITCPYHSWTYGLDGSLIAIARQDAFEAVNKADFNLAELPSREFGGLIWACLDRDVEPDFSALVPEIEADLVSLDIPTAHVYGHRAFNLKANWKLVLEPFMESYHVPRLHAASIGSLFGDVTRVIDLLGPHQRKTAGKVNFQPDMVDIPGENIHKTVTFAYQLFPNAVLITSPYYISLMILMPVSERETNVDYYMLTLEAPQTEKAEEVAARSLELILKVFGEEDFRAAEISQEGLESKALRYMTYGGMENTIPMYYKQLDSCVEAS